MIARAQCQPLTAAFTAFATAVALVCFAGNSGCASTSTAAAERDTTSPAAPSFFQGCVQHPETPLGVVCDGRVVFVLCSHSGLCDVQLESASFLVAAQTDASSLGRVLVTTGTREVEGAEIESLAIKRRDGQDVVIAERYRGKDGDVFGNAVCARPALDRFAPRCETLMRAVIADAITLASFKNLEDKVPTERVPLSVAERPFATPSDCPDISVERGEQTMGIEAPIKGAQLKCADATLTWTTTSTLKAAMGMLFAPPPGGPLVSARVPCEIEGVSTNCARWMGKETGSRLVEGFVRVRERVLFARCEWNDTADPSPLPAPCDEVFSVAPLSITRTAATP